MGLCIIVYKNIIIYESWKLLLHLYKASRCVYATLYTDVLPPGLSACPGLIIIIEAMLHQSRAVIRSGLSQELLLILCILTEDCM